MFHRRYFGRCMQCGFCRDACCQHGVDVSIVERNRILDRASELSPLVESPVTEWFESTLTPDSEFPGGASTRTQIRNGRCVFLRREGRGCVLHGHALESGLDYHDLKPMVSALFPVTFGGAALFCSEELTDASLVCIGHGPTAYEMARFELEYYFGPELVEELDRLVFTAVA